MASSGWDNFGLGAAGFLGGMLDANPFIRRAIMNPLRSGLQAARSGKERQVWDPKRPGVYVDDDQEMGWGEAILGVGPSAYFNYPTDRDGAWKEQMTADGLKRLRLPDPKTLSPERRHLVPPPTLTAPADEPSYNQTTTSDDLFYQNLLVDPFGGW